MIRVSTVVLACVAVLAAQPAAAQAVKSRFKADVAGKPDLAVVAVRQDNTAFGCAVNYEAVIRSMNGAAVITPFVVRLTWIATSGDAFVGTRSYDKTIDKMPGGSQIVVKYPCVGSASRATNLYSVTIDPEETIAEVTRANNVGRS